MYLCHVMNVCYYSSLFKCGYVHQAHISVDVSIYQNIIACFNHVSICSRRCERVSIDGHICVNIVLLMKRFLDSELLLFLWFLDLFFLKSIQVKRRMNDDEADITKRSLCGCVYMYICMFVHITEYRHFRSLN